MGNPAEDAPRKVTEGGYDELADAIDEGHVAPRDAATMQKWRAREANAGLRSISDKLTQFADKFPWFAAQWRREITAALKRTNDQRQFDAFTDSVPLFGLGYLLKKSPAGVRSSASRYFDLSIPLDVPVAEHWAENIKSITVGWRDLEDAVAEENARLKEANVPMVITANVVLHRPSQISNKGQTYRVIFNAVYHEWDKDDGGGDDSDGTASSRPASRAPSSRPKTRRRASTQPDEGTLDDQPSDDEQTRGDASAAHEEQEVARDPGLKLVVRPSRRSYRKTFKSVAGDIGSEKLKASPGFDEINAAQKWLNRPDIKNSEAAAPWKPVKSYFPGTITLNEATKEKWDGTVMYIAWSNNRRRFFIGTDHVGSFVEYEWKREEQRIVDYA